MTRESWSRGPTKGRLRGFSNLDMVWGRKRKVASKKVGGRKHGGVWIWSRGREPSGRKSTPLPSPLLLIPLYVQIIVDLFSAERRDVLLPCTRMDDSQPLASRSLSQDLDIGSSSAMEQLQVEVSSEVR